MISLLVVNYRSSDLAVAAIRSARAATTQPLEVIVVDNSCDAAEAAALRANAEEVIVSAANVGYAAAINRGRQSCRAELLVVCNPDVVFGPGAIDTLAAALRDDTAAMAGPALFWDEAHAWLLPPSDLHTLTEKLSEVLATRSALWWHRRDRKRFFWRLRFWSLRETTPIPAISGAIMAIRAADFDGVGGFDESFALYFEETDFMRRLARRGRRILYVPSARCRHLYNQSAGADRTRAAVAYERSELRYLEKWSVPAVARLLKRMERPPFVPGTPRTEGTVELPPGEMVVEASPLPNFATAAGHFPPARRVSIPAEVWSAYRGDVLYLRAVDRATGRPLAVWARYRDVD
jgi:N-acetylglucosaminyl-diphospho-decaprenol L-rhamnosyltransferase